MIADWSDRLSSLEKILQLVGYDADWMNNDADEDAHWKYVVAHWVRCDCALKYRKWYVVGEV